MKNYLLNCYSSFGFFKSVKRGGDYYMEGYILLNSSQLLLYILNDLFDQIGTFSKFWTCLLLYFQSEHIEIFSSQLQQLLNVCYANVFNLTISLIETREPFKSLNRTKCIVLTENIMTFKHLYLRSYFSSVIQFLVISGIRASSRQPGFGRTCVQFAT